ncbi:6-phosphogluconolactonase [Lewinella marina]|uniref:6-phosphogluconolactonase n=1 Tax=Neolewinella marina TaxID=438751 RepID=A0A2G0CCT0_9BACT|nr:beta-propeller fold lactonase family protein [Neolewinella marina]NJB87593.1 6-phosphogluconolactonase [Neolewinella marina]PHK97717.1 hypothetical protein CGL56_14930 [Neolewinella marina]
MLLIVGGYTATMSDDAPGKASGISAYDFSPKDGRLEYRGHGKTTNPSYTCTDPARRMVYGVRECSRQDGAGVTAFRLQRGKGNKVVFEPTSNVSLEGDAPCHVALAERSLIVSCYASGTVHVVSLEDDGRIGEVRQRITLSAGEADPHAHCSVYDAARSRVYLCDLGSDRLRIFDRSPDGLLTERRDWTIHFPEGSGPRHLVLHPSGEYLLVNFEYRGRLALVDLREGAPRVALNVPTLPERVVEGTSGAAIRLDRGGRNVYVSERKYSVISALRLEAAKPLLTLRDTLPSGGLRPRDILLSPDDQWLLAANLQDHSIGVFRVGAGGGLRLNHVIRKVPSPTSLAWMPGL